MKIIKELSNKFQWMAILCAFMVVIIHLPKGNDKGGGIIQQFLADGLCRMAVPYFFMAAGYFLCGHCGGRFNWWLQEIKKRIKSLIIPYFIVSLIGFALYLFKNRSLPNLIDFFGLNPYCDPGVVQLWFIRSLFILVIISPLLNFIYKNKKIFIPFIILSISAYGFISPVTGYGHGGHLYAVCRWFFSLEGLVYFTIGMFLRNMKINLLKLKFSVAIGCAILGFLLLIARVFLSNLGILSSYYCCWSAIPFLIVGFWYLVPEYSLPSYLLELSFPVYLLHKFLNAILNIAVSKLDSEYFANPVVYLFSAIVIFTVSCCLFRIIEKIFPKFAAIMVGGRLNIR